MYPGHLRGGQLPAKEPAAHAPGRGLLCFIPGQLLLLAAAYSCLVHEETAPARGPLDRATPSGPLQPLQHPLGDHDDPPLLAAALGLCRLRVGHRHAAFCTLRPVCCRLFLPGRLHPTPPAGPPQLPASLPHLPADSPVNSSPGDEVWAPSLRAAIRATQEVRGQGQPAIPAQGYLLLLLLIFFFFFGLYTMSSFQGM